MGVFQCFNLGNNTFIPDRIPQRGEGDLGGFLQRVGSAQFRCSRRNRTNFKRTILSSRNRVLRRVLVRDRILKGDDYL